jgi:hypothetical protein
MLREWNFCFKSICTIIAFFFVSVSFAQDNSPYSRYGLGNAVPPTNIITRGMGGISTGYADFLSVNFNNPASYSSFQGIPELRSKKLQSGRVLLDVGVNIESRTLRVPNDPQKFTSSNGLFSYIQVGVPLRKNWGLSFGLRPLTRIGYKIDQRQQLFNPGTTNLIDSALTQFTGTGGSYLPSIGTGFAIKNFSVGVNMGYLFGRKETTTRRALFNDTVTYRSSVHTTNTSFGNIFFNGGAQYRINFEGDANTPRQTYLRLGVSGNLQQNIKATQDVLRQSFAGDGTSDIADTVSSKRDVKGTIIYPSSYTAGFVLEHRTEKGAGWLVGTDLTQGKWNNYRYYGATDLVHDNWQLHVGGQYRPEPAKSYLSNIAYRAGFFVGQDYIRVQEGLPQFGLTFGVGLPVANYNRQSLGQFTILNLALEYERRGNNDNLIKENMFRLSVGLNFSDLWFNKRKYD